MKLADFPDIEEDIKMHLTLPSVLKELHAIMPFKRYLHPDGPVNLARYVHWAMHKPDIQAKFFTGDGSLAETTNLHTDLTEAASICVHAEPCPDSEKEDQIEFLSHHLPGYDESQLRGRPAALWHVFVPDAYEAVKT